MALFTLETMRQRPETAIAHIAAYQMGAIALPLSHLFGPDALEYRLRDAGACCAVVDADTLPRLWPLLSRLPQLKRIIGVAGARETGVEDWNALLAAGIDLGDTRTARPV